MSLRKLLGDIRHTVSVAFTGESPRTFQRLPQYRGELDWSAVLTYCARADLWEAYPLGLTPAGRGEFLKWCRDHGSGWGASERSALSGLNALDRHLDRGLVLTYRFRPEWQKKFPYALDSTKHFRELCDWVATKHDCRGLWLREATLDPTDIELSADNGVNVIALWRYVSGLQEEARQYELALVQAGFLAAKRATPSPPRMGENQELTAIDVERFPITIVKAGAMEPFDDTFPACGLHPREAVYRIAAWSWELEEFPADVLKKATLADEFWTPSEFSAIGLRQHVKDRPVHVVPPSVGTLDVAKRSREFFGLPTAETLFLFTFDLSSILERKNPLGSISAFRQAFQPIDSARLVLKINRAESFPEQMKQIEAACAGLRCTIITGTLPRPDLLALFQVCDSYVSLHRSEGFGYTLAEAMLLGKPVIATDYSATAEFLDSSVGLPVRYTKVRLEQDYGPYFAGASWAEPDITHAAEQMRWVHEHPAEAKAMGAKAKEFAFDRFSVDRFRQVLQERLAEVRQALNQRTG
jgi:glycosyltransferase involved in cell wall biosynthesis